MKRFKVFAMVLVLVAGLSVSAMAHKHVHFELYGGVGLNSMAEALSLRYDGDPEFQKSTERGSGWYVGGRYWLTDGFAAGIWVENFGVTHAERWSYDAPDWQSHGASYGELSATGVVATGSYPVGSGERWSFLLHGGAGFYRIERNERSKGHSAEYDADGNLLAEYEWINNTKYSLEPAIGFLLAAQMNAAVTEKISLDAQVSYRSLSTDVTKMTNDWKGPVMQGDDWFIGSGTDVYIPEQSRYNLNGWAVDLGLTYHF